MEKHLNPLKKEFLIRQYKSNPRLKIRDFWETHSISVGAFQKWIKQYEGAGWKVWLEPTLRPKKCYPKGSAEQRRLTKARSSSCG